MKVKLEVRAKVKVKVKYLKLLPSNFWVLVFLKVKFNLYTKSESEGPETLPIQFLNPCFFIRKKRNSTITKESESEGPEILPIQFLNPCFYPQSQTFLQPPLGPLELAAAANSMFFKLQVVSLLPGKVYPGAQICPLFKLYKLYTGHWSEHIYVPSLSEPDLWYI